MKKNIYYVSAALLFIIIALFISHFVINKKSESLSLSANAQVKSLLDQSELSIGSSPDIAFKKANEALNQSKSLNNKEYIIQSMEILAEVKNIQGDTKQSLKIYLQAFDIAIKEKSFYEISKINIEIGKVFYNWGQYDTSLIYFNKALAIAREKEEKHLTSLALTYIGKYYYVKGQFEQAMKFFQESLMIAKEINDYNQIAFTLDTEGKYYIGEGDLISALQCYQDAYKASEKLNNQLLLAEVCNHLGGLYLLTKQYEKSLEFHRKALSFRNMMNNPEGRAKSYNNIGKAYLELNKTDSALIYFKQSLALCKETGYKKGLIKALTNMGKVYYLQNYTKLSEELLLQAFNIAEKADYNLGIAELSQTLGDFYKSYKSTEKAIQFYEISLKSLKNLDFDELLKINYLGLYECYDDKKDYKKALKYHEMLFATEKKLLNVDNNRQLAILQITYNGERKEKDNQVLRKDNELKAMTIKRENTFLWLIIALLFSSILFCLFIYNRFYSKLKANKKLKELNDKISNQNNTLEKLNKDLNMANEEKDKLFSIIAHELRNPLFWFQNLAEVLSKNFQNMKPEKIQKSLSALDESAKNAFQLMDNLLHWTRSSLNQIKLKMNVFLLNNLVDESLKMYETIIQHKEIKLKILISESIIVYTDSDLLSCILRNLVSNAIKFTPVEGTISIECKESKEFITIIVNDTGTGIIFENSEDIFTNNTNQLKQGLMHEKGSGLGLKLCKEFVEMIGGKIWVTNNDEKGTRFIFTIPNGKIYFSKDLKVEAFEESFVQ